MLPNEINFKLNNILIGARISKISHYQGFDIDFLLNKNVFNLHFLSLNIYSDWVIVDASEWDNFHAPISYPEKIDEAKKAYFLFHLAYNNAVKEVVVNNNYSLLICFENGWNISIPSNSEFDEFSWVFENNLNNFFLAYYNDENRILTTPL